MTLSLSRAHPSVPSENWDDDFDFQHQSGSQRRPRNIHDNSTTIRMSSATEDWDVDNIASTTSVTNHDSSRPTAVLVDRLNINTNNLQEWTESDPLTPQKHSFPSDIMTENWDDDFLDKADSPAGRSTLAPSTPSKNSISGKLRAGVPLQHRKTSRHHSDEEEHESWDDEFDFNSSPVKPTKPPTPRRLRRPSTRQPENKSSSSGRQHYGGFDDDDDDDDAEGFDAANAEEDRTVTARSRRAPFHSLPPPVPPISFTSLSTMHSTNTNTHLTTPFPRSPTASVFSVPTSSIADTTSLRSTAPLRPSLARNPGSNTLKYLPPSPPIHRERRRLRKKSRPQPQGMMELLDMRDHPPSDTEADRRIEECDERRTPSPPPAPQAISTSLPQTPSQSQVNGAGGALLSRIGSVKRWTARRKRGSTTPSEVAKDEDKAKDPSRADNHQSSHPHPSLSSSFHSNPTPLTLPPQSSNWFFRSSSPSTSRGRASLGSNNGATRSSYTGSRSGSTTDLSMRGSIYASSSIDNEDEPPVPRTPNKLVKRKSFGLAQLKKGSGGKMPPAKERAPEQDEERGSPPEAQKPSSKRPVSMQDRNLPSAMRQAVSQRHASYGTPKAKKPDASTDDLHDSERSQGHPLPKTPRSEAWDTYTGEHRKGIEEKERDKKEGSRGFMGSVRKLSFVGRHKRTKSGASLSNMEMLTKVPSESLSTPAPLEPAPDAPPLLPPLLPLPVVDIPQPETPPFPPPALLPPIELQPPSPPRGNKDIPFTTSLSSGIDALFSPSSFGPSLPQPTPPSSSFPKSSKSPEFVHSPNTPRSPKSPSSPQSVSLGRSTISPTNVNVNPGSAPRRNSLSDLKSDLKIPARISQAQIGLKRDLGMVREFAIYIERLKSQQEAYHDLVLQMQQKLDAQAQLHSQQHSARAVSPSFLSNLSRPKTRARSNTNPGYHAGQLYKELAAAFYTINSKYRISWECAELLIELADGSSNAGGLGPPSSTSAPIALNMGFEKRNRERAITLAGDESKPPTPTPGAPHPSSTSGSVPTMVSPNAWRASTGRHDLSHRQLVLLREMLNNAEAVLSTDESEYPLPEGASSPVESPRNIKVNKEWRWGDPGSSTVTLPQEEQGGEHPKKKRRMSRLGVGMNGLKDMLKALKKGYTDSKVQVYPPLPSTHNHAILSTVSLNVDTGRALPRQAIQPQRQRPKSSSGPESMAKSWKERGREQEPKEPSATAYGPSLKVKPSPRRPSLASIFRLGTRKNTPPSTSTTNLSMYSSDGHGTDASRPTTSLGSVQHSSSTGEEDWDQMDSASDLEAAAQALGVDVGGENSKDGGATVRLRKGRSPYLQYQAPSSSGRLGQPTTPRRSASGSQLSLWSESPSKSKGKSRAQQATPRAKRLSNVDENVEGQKLRERERARRPSSRASGKIVKSGSVRSMPPQAVTPDSKIAMTPENIKPLLENAKEVHTRLGDCIREIRRLVEGDGLGERSVSGSTSASGQSFVSRDL